MEIIITEAGPSRKKVKISVSAEEVQKKFDEKVEELRTGSPIKGFRPGKVPPPLIEKKYGPSIIKDLKTTFLVEGYQEAIKNHNLQPLKEPEVKEETIQLKKGESCTIEFTVEVLPEFEIGNYKGIEIKHPTVRIAPKEIDAALTDLVKGRGEWVYVPDAISEEGDQVICDVNLKVKDKLIWGKENFAAEVQDFEIMGIAVGKKLFIGKKVGDVAQKAVTLPPDFKIAEYGDEKGEISFTILEIKKVKMPELNDAFAVEVGAQDLPDLKNRLRQELKDQKEKGLNELIERELIETLVTATEINIPPEFLKSRISQVTEDAEEKMRKEGKSDAKIKAQIDKTQDRVKEDVIKELKEYLIIEKIAHLEKIEVSDEEIEKKLVELAARERKWPNEIREEYEQKGLMEELKYGVKSQKVLTFLRENAKIV